MEADVLTIFLRIVHIVSGALWVGGGILLTGFMWPRAAALGPAVAGPFNRAANPVAGMAFTIAGVLVIASGTAMAVRARWDALDTFFSFGWGYAILIGFICTVIALGIGAAVVRPAGGRIAALTSGPPDPSDMPEIMRLGQRVRFWGTFAIGLVVIAAGSMAAARFL